MSTDFNGNYTMSHNGSSKMPQFDIAYLDNQGYSGLNELMRAIILRCVDDYHSKSEFKEEALAYMNGETGNDGEKDNDYIFSFDSICSHLGLNTEKTRYAIINAEKKISTRRRAA